MAAIHYISLKLLEEVCHRLAVDLFDKEREPIATFAAGDLGKLDSSLNAPRAGFGEYEQYPTLQEKGAVLAYALIKNHPFPNGNKRIAVTTLMVFLRINSMRLAVSQETLVRFARRIARSDAADREHVLRNATRWVARHGVPLAT